MKKMNIIVFTYKADISGGSNRSLLSILEILVNESHNVTLILPKKTGGMYAAAKEIGIQCIYQPFGRICAKKVRGIGLLKQYLRLYIKLIWDVCYTRIRSYQYKKLHPDIVYTNGTIVHAGRLLAKCLDIPHVYHIREFIESYQLMPINVYNMMSNGTSKFILISNDLYNVYKKQIHESKLEMISNGIKYVEQPPKNKHDGFNMLMTARICSGKRQIDAIEAMNIICKEVKDVHLYFAGNTVNESDVLYKNVLTIYIKSHELEDRITFLGEIKDMSSLRQNMDIELLCSEREAFGRVTVEAMRSSLPVIGSNTGGSKDIIIPGENGYLYEVGNPEDLAKYIMKLYSDKDLLYSLSDKAQEFSKSHFTEKQLYKTVNLLKSLVNNP